MLEEHAIALIVPTQPGGDERDDVAGGRAAISDASTRTVTVQARGPTTAIWTHQPFCTRVTPNTYKSHTSEPTTMDSGSCDFDLHARFD